MRAPKTEETLSTEDQLRALKEDLARRASEPRAAAADPPPPPQAPPQAAPAPKPPPVIVQPHLPLPVGTQPMLDAQLGEALKIMRDYANWVHLPAADIHYCMQVGDALARMMTASATLATVAARFQNGEPESRHHRIIEYVEPKVPEGEGDPKSRKRIKRDNG